MNTIRTTITLHPKTFMKLKTFVGRTDLSMSQVIDAGILRVINDVDKNRPTKIWQSLKKMVGTGKANTPELAQKTVDDILYGDDGAWRGSEQ